MHLYIVENPIADHTGGKDRRREPEKIDKLSSVVSCAMRFTYMCTHPERCAPLLWGKVASLASLAIVEIETHTHQLSKLRVHAAENTIHTPRLQSSGCHPHFPTFTCAAQYNTPASAGRYAAKLHPILHCHNGSQTHGQRANAARTKHLANCSYMQMSCALAASPSALHHPRSVFGLRHRRRCTRINGRTVGTRWGRTVMQCKHAHDMR